MRLTIVLILLLLPIGPAVAASQCGSSPHLENEYLKRLVESGAHGLARLRARGKVLENAVARDLKRFNDAYPKSDSSAVGAYYFYQVCRSILENSSAGKALNRYDLHKLKVVAEALGNPQSMQPVLESLTSEHEMASEARRESYKARRRQATAKNAQPETETHAQKKRFRIEQAPPAGQVPKMAEEPKSAPNSGGTTTGPAAPNGSEPRAGTSMPETAAESAPPPVPTREFSFEAAEQPAVTKKDKGCAELGVIGGDCMNFEAVIRNLKEVPLAYNHPKSMYLGKRTQISLVLKTNDQDHKEELEGLRGEVKEGKTKISRVMQAELIGEAFKIEPRGPQQRTITTLAPVKWTWFATPLEEGDNKNLTLELSAIIREGTRDLPPVAIRTFRTNIKVDVKWWDLLIHRVQAFDPIYQLATAIGGVVTFILFVWRVAVWMRRRDSAGEAV